MRLWRRIIRLDMSDVVHRVTIVGNDTTGYSETSTLLPPTQGLKDKTPMYRVPWNPWQVNQEVHRTVLGVGSRPVRFTTVRPFRSLIALACRMRMLRVPPISTVIVCSVFYLYAMQPQTTTALLYSITATCAPDCMPFIATMSTVHVPLTAWRKHGKTLKRKLCPRLLISSLNHTQYRPPGAERTDRVVLIGRGLRDRLGDF